MSASFASPALQKIQISLTFSPTIRQDSFPKTCASLASPPQKFCIIFINGPQNKTNFETFWPTTLLNSPPPKLDFTLPERVHLAPISLILTSFANQTFSHAYGWLSKKWHFSQNGLILIGFKQNGCLQKHYHETVWLQNVTFHKTVWSWLVLNKTVASGSVITKRSDSKTWLFIKWFDLNRQSILNKPVASRSIITKQSGTKCHFSQNGPKCCGLNRL